MKGTIKYHVFCPSLYVVFDCLELKQNFMYEVKGLQMMTQIMEEMGYPHPETNTTEWDHFTVRLIDYLRTGGKATVRQAVYMADMIILAFPKLYHNIEAEEWYLPKKENNYIYWVMGDDEMMVFVATFIKATIPMLYSASLSKTTLDTLKQDVRILILPDNIDPKGYFVFKNGILDIQKRELLESAEGIFTHQYPYLFDEDDTEAIERANKFMDSFVCEYWNETERTKTRALLYECLLYGCHQRHLMKKVFVFYGDSNTGKSTFPKIWNKLLRKRYVLVPEDADRKICDMFFMYAIHQAQVVHMDEVNGKSRKLRDFIKAMSTPQSNTSVRVPGGTSRSVDVSCLMTFTTNHIFKFKESSKAMWNRLMPIHFAQIQEVKPNWDVEEVLTNRLQTDLLIAMIHETKFWGTKIPGREDGWTMPTETIKLREVFCENEDDEGKLFRGILVKGSNWIRTNDLMDKLNQIIYSHNGLLTTKEDMIESLTRITFNLRFQRIAARLGLDVKQEKSPIEIIDPKDKKNKRILMATGWTGIKFIQLMQTEAITEWEKLENGMLDPEDELLEEKTPFDSLF